METGEPLWTEAELVMKEGLDLWGVGAINNINVGYTADAESLTVDQMGTL